MDKSTVMWLWKAEAILPSAAQKIMHADLSSSMYCSTLYRAMLFIAADPAEVKSEVSPKASWLAACRQAGCNPAYLSTAPEWCPSELSLGHIRAGVCCRRLNRTVMMAERPRQDDNPADKLGAAVEDKLEGFVEVGDLLQRTVQGLVDQPRSRVVVVDQVWGLVQWQRGRAGVCAQAKMQVSATWAMHCWTAAQLNSESIAMDGALLGSAGRLHVRELRTGCCCINHHHAGAECWMAGYGTCRKVLATQGHLPLASGRLLLAKRCAEVCEGRGMQEHMHCCCTGQVEERLWPSFRPGLAPVHF